MNELNIRIDVLADFAMTLTVRDENENIQDLTGCTAAAQLRESPEAYDHYDFTVTHDDAGGHILMEMPHDVTGLIPFTEGVYDLVLTTPTEVIKICYGKAEIVPAVTR